MHVERSFGSWEGGYIPWGEERESAQESKLVPIFSHAQGITISTCTAPKNEFVERTISKEGYPRKSDSTVTTSWPLAGLLDVQVS
jgi:hypothetical protein